MIATNLRIEKNPPVIEIEDEVELLSKYSSSILQAGISLKKSEVVNFYVALKSRPLVILAGPENSKKEILIQCLTRLLFGKDCYQCQMLTGHPRWAEKTGNSPLFVQFHTRFNSEKIFSLLEEALEPENSQRVFLASLIQISPAELLSFFASLGFQAQYHEVIRFGDIHLFTPLPFPQNLFLVGTMDVFPFDGWSLDLLSGATVIQLGEQNANGPSCPISTDTLWSGEKIFLASCFRGVEPAYRHLHNVLGRQRTPLEPLIEIKSLIEKHQVKIPTQVTNDIMIYLANAWSIDGTGLFDRSILRNLEQALDYAIAQLLLPWLILNKRDMNMPIEVLYRYFDTRFPACTEQVRRYS